MYSITNVCSIVNSDLSAVNTYTLIGETNTSKTITADLSLYKELLLCVKYSGIIMNATRISIDMFKTHGAFESRLEASKLTVLEYINDTSFRLITNSTDTTGYVYGIK